jgi:hypothetical protein
MIEKLTPDGEIVKLLESAISLQKLNNYGRVLSYEQFLERPLPHADIPMSASGLDFRKEKPNIIGILNQCVKLLGYDDVSNCNVMQQNSQLPWHTNSNLLGWRTYYIKGHGVFKYIDENGEQKISEDNKDGWTVNRFLIDNKKPLWHSVYAHEKRYAFGFIKHI